MKTNSSLATKGATKGATEGNDYPTIHPVHTAVKGRARLRVEGLRRREDLRAAIESAFAVKPGIYQVSASSLTGNVLIVYQAHLNLDDLLSELEEVVYSVGNGRVVSSPPRPAGRSRARQLTLVKGERTAPVRAWHAMEGEEIVSLLESSGSEGLSTTAAAERLGQYGSNALREVARRSELSIFLGQLKSLPVALLSGSAVLSVFTGGLVDAVVIMGVVLINATIGYVTESQAEKTISALTSISQPTVPVLRDGRVETIETEAIVPGDLLVLMPGLLIAADARLLEARNLSIDESALTGESVPVGKHGAILSNGEVVPLADRLNMVYRGTIVTGGSGLAIVVATGSATEIGIIQALVGETRPPETPMQRQLDRLGSQMVFLSAGICGVVFVVGMLRGYGMLEMLKAAISLAVAAVPEGLPTVATTTLALGLREMQRRKVLIRHLDAVESLGAVQVLCLDKTGTLTMNKMSVLKIFAGRRTYHLEGQGIIESGRPVDPQSIEELLRLMQVAVICNETEINREQDIYILSGSPTESALVRMAIAGGVHVGALRRQYTQLKIEYRAEGRNYMTSLLESADGRRLAAVKGSPEEVLALCRYQIVDGEIRELSGDDRERILGENEVMAGEALRVLGFAYADLVTEDLTELPELVWLGLAGMADPIRDGVKELIGLFHQAGIKTVMITGDQSATAYAIGKALGLSGDEPLESLDSTHLDQVDPQLLSALAEKVEIFSRVSPANKLQIVQALQRAGRVVAMTGDGINDGPALKAADIGVAMGSAGAEVARNVADVVLEDDNLQTMIIAVSQGRTIYHNIRKSIHFLMSSNMSEIMVMLGSIGAGMGQPLSPIQLLWINLMTDIFPALALAVEPPEPDVLRRPPRDPAEEILRPQDFKRYGIESLSITAGTMAAYGYGVMRYGIGPQAGSIASTTLILSQLLHAYGCRSDELGLFSRERLAPNKWLNVAFGGSLLLQAAATLVPGVRGILGTVLPGPLDLLPIAAGAVGPYLLNESIKGVRQRRTDNLNGSNQSPEGSVA